MSCLQLLLLNVWLFCDHSWETGEGGFLLWLHLQLAGLEG